MPQKTDRPQFGYTIHLYCELCEPISGISATTFGPIVSKYIL